MADYRIFSGNATGQTNRGGFTDDLGVQFTVTTDGVHDATINGFYFWAPSTGDFDHTKYSWRLYSSTNGTSGTLISGSTTNVAVDFTASSWNYQALASPITLTSGTTYYAVLHSTSTDASHYTGTDSYWSSGAGASGISSGPLFAPGTSTALNGAQCAYNEPSSTAAFPVNSFGTNYWLDVSISYDGPTTDVFTSSGTWTAPTGVTSATVRCWGGGGAGGGGGTTSAAGGGGAGGSFASSVLSVTAGSNYTVTVGSGGSPSSPSVGTNGTTNPGGDSWFNTSSTIKAQGGAGGEDRSSSGNGAGGAGSTASSIGTTLYAGGDGAAGNSASIGGGGGGGAGTTGAGGSASGSTAGTGTSLLGGNGGAGHSGSGTPNAGQSYGGGGGGNRATSSTDRIGGAGADGRVEIQWQVITAVNASAGTAAATAAASGPTVTLAAHPAPAQAAATASAKTPVVAVGIPAGKAVATGDAKSPTITLATGATVGTATAVGAGNSVSVGVSVGAGVSAASVNVNGIVLPDATAHAVPAVIRMEAYATPLGTRTDEAQVEVSVGDPLVQIDVSVDAGLVEVEAAVGDVTASSELVVNTDLIGASVDVSRPDIVSSSNTPAGKAAASVSGYTPALGIGIGSPPVASVSADAKPASALTVGGSSAQVRALRVANEVERTYRLPAENRTIKIGRS